ncbi:cytochrome d ubiquinol oxidase subunit II [Paenibacillus sp. P96]|uniref:Cytochrome d ubiquinol oxidase subunit II n=1 Tax=Paenibacillus zeirhizosphaerae TaxID=2987519 RepID=A0ABT9FWG6_9BACL|nr:cytochrome d ubiquinol oxidase subunit II [Paenibacillus sp. P96]MDP4098832.1 cytochrome d ubiquinol oxidase subunit II [Paenibacillus sp. P96]
MLLNELWFVLIAVLFTGFFFLEGFDFGVGMATGVLSRSDLEKRVLINTIGPFWDANEVWLITAAGAMFAAFPDWYATMFSGYYGIFTVILLALIVRGVAFEFRSKVDRDVWRKVWDASILFGSVVPPLMFGIIFANLVRGVPIGADMEMRAGLSELVNGYSVWAGGTLVCLCLLHGFTFISLRTTGELRARARHYAARVLPVTAILLLILAGWTISETDLYTRQPLWLPMLLAAALASLLCAFWALRRQKEGWAFVMTGLLILLTFAALFTGLFPRLMVSSLDSSYSLTLYNASSGAYTLKAMTIVASILLPFVLMNQAWSYFVFHKRVSEKDHLEY